MSAQPYSRADRKRAFPRCREGVRANNAQIAAIRAGLDAMRKAASTPAGFVAGGSFSVPLRPGDGDRAPVFFTAR